MKNMLDIPIPNLSQCSSKYTTNIYSFARKKHLFAETEKQKEQRMAFTVYFLRKTNKQIKG